MAEEYVPLDLSNIVRGVVPGFDLYVKQARPAKVLDVASLPDERMILYRSKDLPFTEEAAATLRENRHEVLYYPKSQQHLFETYLENNLTALAQDESLPLECRSEIVYSTSTRIMEDVFKG